MIYNEINNNMKKWIVLIHCICGNEKIFSKQMDFLNKHYNIAIVRLAGHQIQSDIKEASFDYVIEEIHDFTSRKGSKIDVMGVSLGAMITTSYIAKYPNDVDNAYLIGNIYGFSVPLFKTGYMLLLKIRNLLPRSLYMYFITKAILPGKNQNNQRKKLFACSRKFDKELLYAWMNEMGKFILQGKKNLNLTLNTPVNVHLIYGAKDFMFLGWVKRKVKEFQKDKLKVIENAGHLCNIERPEDINKIIKEDYNEDFSNN